MRTQGEDSCLRAKEKGLGGNQPYRCLDCGLLLFSCEKMCICYLSHLDWDLATLANNTVKLVLSANIVQAHRIYCLLFGPFLLVQFCGTVRPNKPKRQSLEQRKIYCRAMQGHGWLMSLKYPEGKGSRVAWCRPAAVAPIRPLAWKLPHAVSAALKKKINK